MAKVEVRGTSYYMNKAIQAHWDSIKDGTLAKLDTDEIICVDGRERTGKSLWTIQQAAYIDPTILDNGPNGELLPRITFTTEDTIKAIRENKSTTEHTKVIIFDEAFRGLSSRSVLSKENKAIISALQEMGQSNLVLFIVTPSFFLLELYAAILRSNFLVHIDITKKGKNKGKRMFKVFNYKKKGILYRNGVRKGWNYNQPTRLKDYFFPTYPMGKDFEDRYRKKKLMYLGRTKGTEDEAEPESKHKIWFENLIKAKYLELKSIRKVEDYLKNVAHVDVSRDLIHKVIGLQPRTYEKLDISSVVSVPTIIN